MTESATEWQQKIINTGEKGKKDSAEGAAITFIEDHIRKGTLPKERIQKLIEAITKTLDQKTHDVIDIKKECEAALQKLENEVALKDILHSKESCRINKFDPANINGVATLKYFEYLAKNPEEEQELYNAFKGNKELYIGFIRYILLQKIGNRINDKSNLSHIGGAENIGVLWMNRQIEKFSNEHKGIVINQLDLGNNHMTGIKDMEKQVNPGKGLLDKAMDTFATVSMTDVFQKAGEQLNEKLFKKYEKSELAVKKQFGLKDIDNLEEKGFSDKGVHGFNKERGNYFISITEFEVMLKSTTDVKTINSRALANYFQYLNKENLLIPEILINRFRSDTLMQLGILWNNGGNTKDGKDSLLAKNMLEKNNAGYIVETIVKLSSGGDKVRKIESLKNAKELDVAILLLAETENKFRAAFISEIKNTLLKKDKTEAEARQGAEKLLQDLLDCKGVTGVVRASQIIKQFNTVNNTKVNKKITTDKALYINIVQNERKLVESRKEELGTTDPSKKAEQKRKQESIKKDVIEGQQAALFNNTLTEDQRNGLSNGTKTTKQVIEELKKEDAEFTREYKALEKEKEKLGQENPIKGPSVQEKEDTDSISKKIPDFTTIKNGQTEQINIGTQGSGNTTGSLEVSITKVNDTISVKIGQQDPISLSQEQYPAYMESMSFLQDIGLGYLAKNLSPKDLQSIFRATSQLGNTNVDNQDSTFGKEEQRLFLKKISHVLGIGEGMTQISTEDMKDYVRGKLQERNFENRANSLGKDWFKNQTIHEENFSQALKST